jgi:hypothetical protein
MNMTPLVSGLISIGVLMPLGFEFSSSLMTLPKQEATPLPDSALSPKEHGALPFGPGESLTFDVDYGIIPAGTARVRVLEGQNGLWRIEAEGKSRRFYDWVFPVRDSYISIVDPARRLPVRFIRSVNEGGYRLEQDYQFNWKEGWCETEEHRRRTPNLEDAFQLPGRIQDMVSAFYFARGMDFSNMTAGDVFSIPTLVDGERFDLRVRYAGMATAKAAGQEWACLVFHPVIEEGRVWSSPDDLTIYISADERHLPVLVESDLLIGAMRMTLVHLN